MQMRISPTTYRKITLSSLIALIAIIITGGAVRLTGSGLGCPDWPTCDRAESVVPTDFHAWVEFINRVITGAVAVAVILAVLGAIFLKPKNKNLIFWASSLVVGVLAQIILGAFVVWLHLTPPIVIAHFLISMYLVYSAVVLHHKTKPNSVHHSAHNLSETHPYIIWLTRLGVLLAVAVIFAGTILTGAGPHGGDEDVRRFDLDIPNLARIHAGLVIAFISIIGLGWIALYYFHRNSHKEIWKNGRILLVVTLAQAVIGYIQYFSDVPEILVGIHIAGAAILWAAVINFYLGACSPLKITKRKIPEQIISSSK